MEKERDLFFVWDFGDLDIDDQKPPWIRNPRQFDDFEFKNGTPHASTPPCMEFEVSRKRVLTDYLFNVLGYPLFSARLRAALGEIGIVNIEYSPARLVTSRGQLLSDDYMAGNVLGLVACFDWERSCYDPSYREHGLADEIEKLVVHVDALAGHLLCRMRENSDVLLVARSVREHLVDKGITGIAFIPIDEYSQ